MKVLLSNQSPPHTDWKYATIYRFPPPAKPWPSKLLVLLLLAGAAVITKSILS